MEWQKKKKKRKKEKRKAIIFSHIFLLFPLLFLYAWCYKFLSFLFLFLDIPLAIFLGHICWWQILWVLPHTEDDLISPSFPGCRILDWGGRGQDGGGLGWGDHFLPYKFIKRTFESWANFTKQLLTTSRRHQAPRKADHHLQKEVGQNIKDKKRDKRARDGDPSWEGSHNRGSFQTPGNPLMGGSGGSFQILKGNLTGRKNK